MPRGDGTGPRGMGAMTGRAAGFCAGFGLPGYLNMVPGRGWGAGFGRGNNMFFATSLPGWRRFGGFAGPFVKPDPEMEKQALKGQADARQAELDAIKKRLSDLEAEAETA